MSNFSIKLLSLILFLLSTNAVLAGSAKINRIWFDHGTVSNGESGITIHTDISVSGMNGKRIKVIAYFYDGAKNKLMGGISGYKTKSGQVCVSKYGTPKYNDSHYSDFSIFIPYRAIPLQVGKHNYQVSVNVQDVSLTSFIAENKIYASFSGTGKNNNNIASTPRNNSETSNGLKKKRINLPNGGYEERYYDKDGNWVKSMEVEPCVICHGTGLYNCLLCSGTGYRYNYYLESTELCPACVGLKWCRSCGGKKTKTSWTFFSNGTITRYDDKGHVASRTIGGGGASNNGTMSTREHSSSSDSPSSNRCKYCGGYGVCLKCKGTGTVFVTGDPCYVTCPSCNGNGRCSICRGTGRI